MHTVRIQFTHVKSILGLLARIPEGRCGLRTWSRGNFIIPLLSEKTWDREMLGKPKLSLNLNTTHLYTYLNTHMHTCIHAHTHPDTHTYLHTCSHTSRHTFTPAYMLTHTQTHIHTCVHAHTHPDTHIHAYMFTCIPTNPHIISYTHCIPIYIV